MAQVGLPFPRTEVGIVLLMHDGDVEFIGMGRVALERIGGDDRADRLLGIGLDEYMRPGRGAFLDVCHDRCSFSFCVGVGSTMSSEAAKQQGCAARCLRILRTAGACRGY